MCNVSFKDALPEFACVNVGHFKVNKTIANWIK